MADLAGSMRQERTGAKCPVTHVSFEAADRPALSAQAMWDELREEGPIHLYQKGMERYLVVGHEEVMAAAQDAETFPQCTKLLTVDDSEALFSLIPLELNGAEHLAWRRLLTRYWSPKAVAAWETRIRECVGEMIDRIKPKGQCEFVDEFARRFPPTIFLEFMGLPVEDLDMLLEWQNNIQHPDFVNPEAATQKLAEAHAGVTKYFTELIAELRALDPDELPDTLVGLALTWEINGEPVSDEQLLSFFTLMFMAGLDTVAAGLAYGFLHLSTHPGHRQQILDDPSIIPNATEELLRAYPFVNLMRDVSADTEIGGCSVSKGAVVVLSLPSAGRDEKAYADANRVDFNRSPIPQVAFGTGSHHCLGANLARKELRIAYEEWHKRIPHYELDPNHVPIEATGQLQTIHSLRLRWDV